MSTSDVGQKLFVKIAYTYLISVSSKHSLIISDIYSHAVMFTVIMQLRS